MSINEMKEYLALCLKGKSSIPLRQDILKSKLSELENKKKELEEAIDFINWKQNFYKDVLDDKVEYFSYLIK